MLKSVHRVPGLCVAFRMIDHCNFMFSSLFTVGGYQGYRLMITTCSTITFPNFKNRDHAKSLTVESNLFIEKR